MTDDTLLVLAADIISAHVSNNAVAADALPGLITAVYGSLAGLGEAPAPVEEVRTPAVSVRSSVKPDTITCLECGKKLKMLKRHLTTDHQLTPSEYRARWSLPADYPLVARNYAETRKELAVKIGLGRKSGKRGPTKSAAEVQPTAAPAVKKRGRKTLAISTN
ncbi:MucR family transcriptional regulator [Novosphingobium sp.]|jgi:predicted transcriptional regulator|uniref:MucR family transcriptional regulator n=1 Tax=Novosphingobium sp. TaxID=1874826 RepID=UPI002FDFA418